MNGLTRFLLSLTFIRLSRSTSSSERCVFQLLVACGTRILLPISTVPARFISSVNHPFQLRPLYTAAFRLVTSSTPSNVRRRRLSEEVFTISSIFQCCAHQTLFSEATTPSDLRSRRQPKEIRTFVGFEPRVCTLCAVHPPTVPFNRLRFRLSRVGVPNYYLAKPQPRERAWQNQRGKKTLLSLTLVWHCEKTYEM